MKYTPKAQGKTTINVNVRAKPIQNSPFNVNVDKLGKFPLLKHKTLTD